MPREEITAREMELQRAKLGIEAEAFERSAIGKYLYDLIEVQVEDLTAKLVAADPNDIAENNRLRNEIKTRAMIPVWIKEAINSGRMAVQRIEDEEIIEH
jgi:hypothetical protein